MKVDVVLVTYNPEPDKLLACITSLSDQVEKVWVIDNASVNGVEESLKNLADRINYIALEENKGIAFAQNCGIKLAVSDKADYIVLSDQDTVYPSNFAEEMISAFTNATNPESIAAVAPSFFDNVKGINESFMVETKFGYGKIYPNKGLHQISFAIASGKVLNVSVLAKIGLMSTDLFIDWVDMEWCWRAGGKGYSILGNADVKIEHQLGDNVVDIVNKNLTVRSPLRHYYMTRNALYLATRSSYLDFYHRLNLIYRGLRYTFLFSLFAAPRKRNMVMTLKGIYHGLQGRLGPLKL